MKLQTVCKALVLALVALTTVSSVFAKEGHSTGNGGDAVVCFKTVQTRDYVADVLHKNRQALNPIAVFEEQAVRDDVDTVMSYDHFEYIRPLGNPPIARAAVSAQGDYKETLEFLLTRLGSKSNLARILDYWGNFYYPVSQWQPAPGVPEIDDSGDTPYLSRQCLLVQVAQRVRGKVFFDAFLFAKMQPLDQAALVLHEWIYDYHLWAAQKTSYLTGNSTPVREAVGLILSKNEFEKMSQEQVLSFFAKRGIGLSHSKYDLKQLAFPQIDFQISGVAVKIEPYRYAKTAAGEAYPTAGLVFGSVPLPWNKLVADCGSTPCDVDFYEGKSSNGILKEISRGIHDGLGGEPVDVNWLGSTVSLKHMPGEFYSNGTPTSLSLSGNRQQIGIGNRVYRPIVSTSVELHPSGFPKRFELGSNQAINVLSTHVAVTAVEFDEYGRISSLTPFLELDERGQVSDATTYVTVTSGNRKFNCWKGARIELHPDETLRSCWLESAVRLKVGNATMSLKYRTVFYQNGQVKSSLLNEGIEHKVGQRRHKLTFGKIEFYRSEALRSANVKDVVRMQWKGTTVELTGRFLWDRQGRIVSAQLNREAFIDGVRLAKGQTIILN